MALSGAATMPPVPLPMRSGGDDAYMAIISELSRVEEAAHAAGAGAPGGGAVTMTGQQLESFLGHMDMQVSPFETAGQVYRELRSFLKEQTKEIAREAGETFARAKRGSSPLEFDQEHGTEATDGQDEDEQDTSISS